MSRVKDFWESEALRKVLLAALVIYVLLASTVIIVQQRIDSRTLNDHTATLSEVKILRQEVLTLANKLGPALSAGQAKLLTQITTIDNRISWLECSVQIGAASCGPKP